MKDLLTLAYLCLRVSIQCRSLMTKAQQHQLECTVTVGAQTL